MRFGGLSLLLLLLGGCASDLPEGHRATPEGDGPRILWDLYAEPLPDIPLPNDVATWPDPSRATGRRLNASLLVDTETERQIRRYFDELDGWGTFAPITIPFDAEIDVADLLERQGGADNFHERDFPDHAVYVINMETGVPALLDLNGGNFYYTATHVDQYWENDPRDGESNILFETVEEDRNGNGVLDVGEDTDFDGVLDHPNTIDGELGTDFIDTHDRMLWFYERETDTLILRPILPLDQRTTYAVVVTDRLRGADGEPVRSPFSTVHHLRQTEPLEELPAHFAAHPELYGDLADRGWEGVAFAWTFTTQSVTADMDMIRDGLYGEGLMAHLAEDFPVATAPAQMQGPSRGQSCTVEGQSTYIADGDRFRTVLRAIAEQAFGLTDDQIENYMASWAQLDHVVMFYFDSPYFFENPDQEDLNDAFQIDHMTGEARVTNEVLGALVMVPKETAEHQQPFDTSIYVHGHGSNNGEALLFGGLMMQHGMAVALLNAHGHGLEFDDDELRLYDAFFGSECLSPTIRAVAAGRARDHDGDGTLDSGVNFWTASVFHTRDSVRQTVVDHMQAVRIMRSFDGRPATPVTLEERSLGTLEFDGDYDGDGSVDVAGDFDSDGTPDFGGPDANYHFTGGSLGGITSAMFAGMEPAITSAAPIVGAGGLSDVAIRTENGSVLPAMILRLMGPFVMGRAGSEPGRDSGCAAGETSLYFLSTSLTRAARTEFACLPGQYDEDDVMVVRNLDGDIVRCGGVFGGPSQFRVPIPADAGDPVVVELYEDALADIQFGSCEWRGEAPTPDVVVDTFQVSNGVAGAGRCPNCARFEDQIWEQGEALVAPTHGFGRQRQTPDLRRLVMLAQIALESGDPINYARRVFLEPREVAGVERPANNLLMLQTIGDANVCLATGNAFARAAGVLPFLPPDAPDAYAEWRAPASFAGRYEGMPTPNDVLIQRHVLEGIPWLNRHPVEGADDFLSDVDDLSDGLLTFNPDGRSQMHEADGGLRPVRLDPPLRWVRQMRPMSSPSDDAVWSFAPDTDMGGVLNGYVIPRGIHGVNPDEMYNSEVPFDIGVYTFNLLGRYMRTGGQDLPYVSDPEGHHCLEDSSCPYLPARPAP
ncbi:MAG: hypothetical protein SangKO_018440 [Sandaracinaceae bacterium]